MVDVFVSGRRIGLLRRRQLQRLAVLGPAHARLRERASERALEADGIGVVGVAVVHSVWGHKRASSFCRLLKVKLCRRRVIVLAWRAHYANLGAQSMVKYFMNEEKVWR
jgi:hypothetical protein